VETISTRRRDIKKKKGKKEGGIITRGGWSLVRDA